MLRNAVNPKVLQASGSFSLGVRVGPASPAGRPQPASAGRRSWELVLALTPPSVSFVYSKKAGSSGVPESEVRATFIP